MEILDSNKIEMVEADPDNAASAEPFLDLEEQLFDSIDEELRQFHDWCKDLVQEITQRILHLSIKHREIASRFKE